MPGTLQGAGGHSLLSGSIKPVGKGPVSLTIKGTSQSPSGQSMHNPLIHPFLSEDFWGLLASSTPMPPSPATHCDVAEDEEE